MPKPSTPALLPDDGQVLHSALMQRGDEILRDTAKPEAAGGDRHVVVQQAIEGRLGVRVNFAHVEGTLTTDSADGHG